MSKFTYKKSGVDVDAGNRFIEIIKPLVESTYNSNSITKLGSFSGAYALNKDDYESPVLVASTDGVGTKLKVAFSTGILDTVGIDLVAMCVNDIVTSGAKPLFFLDYFATSRLNPEESADVIKGIAAGCRESGCVLLGGETAEMPGFYSSGEFDLAGFAVGIVDKDEIIDGKDVLPGDALIGISSSGLHSNGYSLARKVIFELGGFSTDDIPEGLTRTVGEEMLEPTRIYVDSILALRQNFNIKSVSHITGGGLVDNIPRSIPAGCAVTIDTGSWEMQPIFILIRETGDIDMQEMYRTFNCGIGMVVIVDNKDADRVVEFLNNRSQPSYRIGRVTERPDRERRVKFV